MTCRGKRDTTWNIPRSITFPCYICHVISRKVDFLWDSVECALLLAQMRAKSILFRAAVTFYTDEWHCNQTEKTLDIGGLVQEMFGL